MNILECDSLEWYTNFVVGCWTSQDCQSEYECIDGACQAGKCLIAYDILLIYSQRLMRLTKD